MKIISNTDKEPVVTGISVYAKNDEMEEIDNILLGWTIFGV